MKRKFLIGRLKEGQDRDVARYLSSLREDRDLFEFEIDVLEAHALTLHKSGILDAPSLRKILVSLESIRRDREFRKKIEDSAFVDSPEFYDIHPAVESYLIKKTGMDKGGFINLGKSRNDHVVADIRLFMREKLLGFATSLLSLILSFIKKAEKNLFKPFVAFTHSQPAQLTTFGYYLLSHIYPLLRTLDHAVRAFDEINTSPLGACAVAGTGVPLRRGYTARLLGFKGVMENAIDATSSRDFFLVASFPMVEAMIILSRFATDIIHLSSTGYEILDLPDSLTDTSSAMPQKKNASPLELLRARTDEAVSLFSCMGNIVAGRPHGYNQDFQELKVLWWKLCEIVLPSLPIAGKFVEGISLREDVVREKISRFFVTSIDLAEVLTLKYRIPFRLAHEISGRLVDKCIREGRRFEELSEKEINEVVTRISGRKINFMERWIFDPYRNLKEKRNFYSEGALKMQLRRARELLSAEKREVRKRAREIMQARESLKKTVNRVTGKR